MARVVVMIDGGHLRVVTRRSGRDYNPNYIERIAHACVVVGEELLRVLYYDCAPFKGELTLPISGSQQVHDGDDTWLQVLAGKDLFAVRRGVLKFRGFTPKNTPIQGATVSDADFKPTFEQKGVDMRIGLDIANHAANRSVERIILVTADTDCLPAMKHARTRGLQIALVKFPGQHIGRELKWHTDYLRDVVWP